jgi:type VI secretion system protein ImpH
MKRLFEAGHYFDFFQAVRLLENFFPDGKCPGETADFVAEQIRFRPHSGLVFPATDIREIELVVGMPTRARVTATFMGLYGVDSPLPVFFYNSIATESEESKPLADFLDIFNHRLYALLYRSWKKYRLPVQQNISSTKRLLATRVLSLAGLGTKGTLQDSTMPSMRLAAYAGLLSMRVRNAEGLQHFLTGFLDGANVSIQQNIARWVDIPHRGKVGRSREAALTLGSTACIGERVFDVSGKFRIVVGPLTFMQYLLLLPGAVTAKLVQFLVQLYVRDYLDYDVQLKLKSREIPVMKLSDKASKLGLTTWLGKPKEEITSRIIGFN